MSGKKHDAVIVLCLYFEEIIGITALPCLREAGSALLCNGQKSPAQLNCTIWTYCHVMDNMNKKASCFGCEKRKTARRTVMQHSLDRREFAADAPV